jgi:hypothetical protein
VPVLMLVLEELLLSLRVKEVFPGRARVTLELQLLLPLPEPRHFLPHVA